MALPQEITGALDKIEEKDLINKFYEFVNQNNIPYYVQNFSSPNAVALRSGVYISKLFFHKYTDYALLYALLHESAHYIRYKDIDYDLVDLTDLPFEEFFKKITIEENYADDLAIKTLTTWIKDLNLNLEKLLKNIENLIDQNISKVQYNQLYNLINHFKKNYTNNNEQLIFDLMNNTLQENILRKKISEVI